MNGWHALDAQRIKHAQAVPEHTTPLRSMPPDERIMLLQEWFGYCLLPDTSLHKFLLAVGPGANGKSVVFRVLTELLGWENVSHVPLEMFGDRFALGDTIGKLANVVSEIGVLDRFDEGRLKAFVSGDRITVDRKYKEPISVQPTARLMLATNEPPRVHDRSQGLWRRVLYLPFEVTIPTEKQNPRLAEELLEELPGVFNWAIQGLARLREQYRFTEPAAYSRAMQEYRIDCDPVRAFLREYYEAAPGSAVSMRYTKERSGRREDWRWVMSWLRAANFFEFSMV